MGQEPQRAETVVDRDDDHAVLEQLRWVPVVALTPDERATVEPDHDRKISVFVTGRGGVDVQIQAVFGRTGNTEFRCRLRAVRSNFEGATHAGPVGSRLRSAPA